MSNDINLAIVKSCVALPNFIVKEHQIIQDHPGIYCTCRPIYKYKLKKTNLYLKHCRYKLFETIVFQTTVLEFIHNF